MHCGRTARAGVRRRPEGGGRPARDVQVTARNAVARALSRHAGVARDDDVSLFTINTCFGASAERGPQIADGEAGGANSNTCELSVRALNVLKLLAADMTGESPTKEGWVPSHSFLRSMTFDTLLSARNCGPTTIAEIVRWAATRGVTITPRFHAGKSLSETWRYLEARFAAGKLTGPEVAEALERSIRRRSARVPLGVQRILLELLNRADEAPRRFKSRSRTP